MAARSGTLESDAASTTTRTTRRADPMAGKHEQARGDGGRADGQKIASGEFVDSDIPGEERHDSREPVGEFTGSEIPGETAASDAPRGGEGSYDDSDIPGENTSSDRHGAADDGAADNGTAGNGTAANDTAETVGSFTDSDIPADGADGASENR
jgi:hypothetical protein